MSFINFLDQLDQKNSNNNENSIDRRTALRQTGQMGMKLATAALPFALAGMVSPQKATAATVSITDVLNYALTLEYLESTYYQTALDTSGLIPSSDVKIFQQIGKHENEHVAFLKSALGSNAISKPTFDFTAGGKYQPFSDYATFLALSQAFEDTGVRAYKGQAGNLMSSGSTLQAALQIHSVEARHASEVRRLRGKKGWIVGAGDDSPNVPSAVYAGEDNITEGGVDVSTVTSVSKMQIAEAFDEPLTMNQVNAIAGLFIKIN